MEKVVNLREWKQKRLERITSAAPAPVFGGVTVRGRNGTGGDRAEFGKWDQIGKPVAVVMNRLRVLKN